MIFTGQDTQEAIEKAFSEDVSSYGHFHRPKGGAYWVQTNNGEMYDMMRELEPVLSVGRLPAERAGISKERYLQLSVLNQTLRADNVAGLTGRFNQVVESGGDLVLGGVEYLSVQISVEETSKLLKGLNERAKRSGATVLIPVDSRCYEPQIWKKLMGDIPQYVE